MSLVLASVAWAQTVRFNHTVTGEVLDLSDGPPEGRDTEAVKEFLQSGENPYNHDNDALKEGEQLYLGACSGCHGHYAEGKVGPGLNDNYWTYPKNEKDKGLFETIYGGANGMMGPQYNALNLDEMLLAMAWVRNLYDGPGKDAKWLPRQERADYVPFSQRKDQAAPAPGG
ncbi:cytochrome c(L), periplasmic [Marinivivus vitaminiproducens]|uniref:cytochrome c(L), periplasmic n=1 Tax=Marinivivus vitaminiproducens TaxID=3035935 RepID=UPI0027A3A7DD|nr:cytochrome c(L), periplasmic [Geminicoccaceae bacterium SCSIO 64248]